jgi:hypothetical protein
LIPNGCGRAMKANTLTVGSEIAATLTATRLG